MGSTSLFGLKRDYSQSGEYRCPYCEYTVWTDEQEDERELKVKLYHLLETIPYMHLYSEDEEEALILEEQGEDHCLYLHCVYCGEEGVCYPGYFDLHFQKYFDHFIDQLEHCFAYCHYRQLSKRCCCQCYWPELTPEAAEISDEAYDLFSKLFRKTELLALKSNFDEQKKLLCFQSWPSGHSFNNRIRLLTLHELVISCISLQFLFSDYYQVCQDIRSYAKSNYYCWDYIEISNRLDAILERLYPMFEDLYFSCLKKHPTDRIKREVEFMHTFKCDFWIFPDQALHN
jgi:hypothetical protein